MDDLLAKSPSPYLTSGYLLGLFREYREPRHKIKRLVDAGDLVHVRNGLYVLGAAYGRGYAVEVLAGIVYGPSALSFEYALGYYGLIPERVSVYTCLCFKRDKRFQTPVGEFRYKYIERRLFPIGLRYRQTELGNFFMASPEKALCDMAYFAKLRNVAAARSYIVDDLRMDVSVVEWQPALLAELRRHYKRKSVQHVVDAVFELMAVEV